MKTLFFYLLLVAVIRLMGKRQVGQMEPSEFAVTMMTANLASMALENPEVSLLKGVAAMLTVLAVERLLSWGCLRSIGLRRVLCGKPVILIENGRLLRENLRRTRVNLDELSGHLREQGVLEIQTVQFAILETNGALTVFQYPWFVPPGAVEMGVQARAQELPYTIISDGKVLAQNLRLAGKSENWLRDHLSAKGLLPKDVLLMTLTPSGKTWMARRNPE